MSIKLLDDAGADATGTSSLVRDTGTNRVNTVFCWGTFSGATAKFQIRPHDEAEWFDPADNSFTAKGAKTFEGSGYQIRGVTTGGDGSTVVQMEIT